jgi:hypothetical protein
MRTTLQEKIRILAYSALFGILLLAAGVCLYWLNKDVFVSVLWYGLIASVLFSDRILLYTTPKLLRFMGVIVLFLIWSLTNTTLLRLLEKAIVTNPYGDYIFNQFNFRLGLSIFILKFVSFFWMTNIRLLLTALMLAGHALMFSALIKYFFRRLPHRCFEFGVFFFKKARFNTENYTGIAIRSALLNAPLWGIAAVLLRFDNSIVLIFIMATSSFIPRLGLFVGALLSLFFVESGLFLLQLGGLLIAAASIWFLDHSLFQNSPQPQTGLFTVVLLAVVIIAYFFASFSGLFLTAPLACISYGIADALHKSLPLRFPPQNAHLNGLVV